MKLTVNLDEALLARAMEATGARTKTETITIALREVDRRAKLRDTLRGGLGANEEELKAMFEPSSDPSVLRVAEDPGTGMSENQGQ